MTPGKLFARLITQTLAATAIMAAVLFGAAGTWRWPQGWAFLGLFLGATAVFAVFLWRRDPGLLAERLSSPVRKDQPLWDRVFLLFAMLAWHLWLGTMALDAVRFGLSHMPVWLNAAGAILIAAGFAAILPVFAANSFAAPVVRLQSERKQHLIDTGPYAVVRHPMYASAIVYLIGLPLLLGSWAGLAVLPLLIVGLTPRMIREERFLARELPGYADYMTRVRWRLVPYVW
jgi:protein-S-isoprenylcysteine O-methyltransferase Ste14